MKMRRLFAAVIALVVVLSSGIFASATEAGEPIDFDTVDWETVRPTDIDTTEFMTWMKTAELHQLFRAINATDGASAMYWQCVVCERMSKDFSGVIAVLAEEDPALQQKIVKFITGGIYSELQEYVKNADFPDMVYSVKVSGSKQEYTLGLFKDAVEERWGIPRTGDRFSVAAVALCVVSMSLICLLTLDYRRKK